ncbi:MAG TPA: TolC family protein [Polyangiaceae bacterium]|nr:TolC family protein [Polyangiaceae bacterium]
MPRSRDIFFRFISVLFVGAAPLTALAEPSTVPRDAAAALPRQPESPTAAPSLRDLVTRAREHAPEVALGRAQLEASRSSYASARMAPVGNPYLEIRADHGNRGVTRDVYIDGSLWLPLEVSGQRKSRGREAADFVAWNAALVEQARAAAAARTVRAYGLLVVAEKRLRVLQELSEATEAEARYYSERLAMGDATERDAALSAVDAARHKMLLSETRSELLRANGELVELTGVRLSDDVPRDPLPSIFSRTPAPAPHVEKAPSLRALQAQAAYYASARERLRKEGQSPVSVGVLAGRGDFGETRLGAGLGYAFPLFRTNQPERARADAERVRALQELSLRREVFSRRVEVLRQELVELRKAFDVLTEAALPAAERAVAAARETYRAGKGDLLSVLVSRRDFSALALRQLEILDRSWQLFSELVEVTGELP